VSFRFSDFIIPSVQSSIFFGSRMQIDADGSQLSLILSTKCKD